jgi:MinD-like ATPase involved in chromosome partitioning or flagellar assembly
LDAAHHQVVVATAERPALRSLRATLDLLDFLYDAGRRSIVVNKTDPASSLSPSDVNRLIKTPIAAALPAANEIPASINRAELLTYAYPDHPVSQAIRRFAQGLASTDGHPVGRSEEAGE